MFRHYWVLIKFLITIPSTIVSLLHMQPIGRLARVAAETRLSSADLGRMRIQLVADAAAALLVLLLATTLSVYKPWGITLLRECTKVFGQLFLGRLSQIWAIPSD